MLNNLEILVEVILVNFPRIETNWRNWKYRGGWILAPFKIWRKNEVLKPIYFVGALLSIGLMFCRVLAVFKSKERWDTLIQFSWFLLWPYPVTSSLGERKLETMTRFSPRPRKEEISQLLAVGKWGIEFLIFLDLFSFFLQLQRDQDANFQEWKSFALSPK